MLLNNNYNNIENESKLGKTIDSLDSLSKKTKITIADAHNLTLKRKRLVRQEAVSQNEDNKDTAEQNESSDPEEKSIKILALQSESARSTETVIEANVTTPCPPIPTSPTGMESRD